MNYEQVETDDDDRQIIDLLRAQGAATARGDAAAVVAPNAEDTVIHALPPPLEQKGAATQAIDGLNQWFATWKDGVTVELAEPSVIVDSDPGEVFGFSRMRGTKKDPGSVDIWSRASSLRRCTEHRPRP